MHEQPLVADDPATRSIHQTPALWPLVGSLIIYAVLAAFFALLPQEPLLQRWFSRLEARYAAEPSDLIPFAAVCLVAALVGLGFELLLRQRQPPVPLHNRLNRSFAYASLLAASANAWFASRSPAHLHHLAYSQHLQLFVLVVILLMTALFFFTALRPVAALEMEELPPYQQMVASLRNSYDFVLGTQFPEDWKKAQSGGRSWAVLKANAIWQNLFILGAIGTGKTAAILIPLIVQALGKYVDDEAMRVSMVILDLKGDLAERVYQLWKKSGGKQDFHVIRPGNCLKNSDGTDIIPSKHFITYDALGSSKDSADVRAELFSSGLQVTAQGETHQFWLDTQVQFLTATLEVHDAVRGPGEYSLADIYDFALDPTLRDKMLKSTQAKSSKARIYFEKYFNTFGKEDQMKLLSGIAAKLSRITGDATKATFCAGPDSPVPKFSSFEDHLLKKSGIIVFSVPEAIYSTELARILGVMFMRAFHNAMLRRTDTIFSAAGGNTKRLVMLLVDECWAYMNPGVASFCNVSRQARVMSVFLTQSLKAIGDQYRDAVLSGFLSKVIFSVNDELTLTTMSKALGQFEETTTNVSTSESLNDAKKRVYTDGMSGKNQGISKSISTQKRTVDRFSPTDLKFQAKQRAVVQMGDGEVAHLPFSFETTPWFKLPYYLFHPLEHDDIGCRKTKRRTPHTYEQREGGEVCTACGHEIDASKRNEIEDYRRSWPEHTPAV